MRYLLMALLIGLSMTTWADELHVVVNGKAIHLDDGEYNEDNWGLGLNYDFTPKNDWIKFFNASFFADSNKNTSTYVGGGIKHRWRLDNDKDGWYTEAGVIAFLMTRKDYKDNEPFPGILPFVGLGNGPVRLNMTYIPSVSPKYKELVFFQLLLRVQTFD